MTADQSQIVYNTYTPFRNFLRKFDLFRSLQAVWAHAVHQQYGMSLPSYIVGTPVGYRNAKNKIDFLNFSLHLWELETIAKEVILNCAQYGSTKSLETWHLLAKADNHLKNLEDKISSVYNTQDNLLLEFHRISHRQFPWQASINQDKLIRYWKVYSPLREYLQSAYDIDFETYFTIGMILFNFYLEHFSLNYPPDIQIEKINIVLFDKFLIRICKDYADLANEIKRELKMDHSYVYAYHSLKGFPLVKMEHGEKIFIVCPLPTLFINRITEGLFYDLINEAGFDNSFGTSFQNYIGEYIELLTSGICNVLPEESYGGRRNKKDTIDWIVTDKSDDVLVIECKTKRMTVEAKSALSDTTSLEDDLKKMSTAVVQVYLSLLDYEKGLYPQLKVINSRRIYIVVATLEEWYLFGDKTKELLDNSVKQLLKEANIDLVYLQRYPYFVMATENIELLARLLKTKTLKEIFEPKLQDPEKTSWNMREYLFDQFRDQLNDRVNPFEEEYNKFVHETMKKMQT